MGFKRTNPEYLQIADAIDELIMEARSIMPKLEQIGETIDATVSSNRGMSNDFAYGIPNIVTEEILPKRSDE